MRLRKYPDGWTRRHFIEQLAKATFAAGVIAPLWDVIGDTGACEAAYPPELLSIESYTRGKLKAGDVLDAHNVDIVKDLLDPFAYWQYKNDGRVSDIVETETNLSRLVWPPFLEATLRNKGMHRIGPDGNVYTRDGKPWIGGNPFPEPASAEELLYCNALTWGKHDAEGDTIREWDTDPDGEPMYTYEMFYVMWQTVGRVVVEPKPYQPGHEQDLRILASVLSTPEDMRGFASLTFWPYDQRKFPTAYNYAPTIKRVRTNQPFERFDPMTPGGTMFASDGWMVGDPLLTWGNFKMVGKGPMLACVSRAAYTDNPDWAAPLCGGKSGKKYFRTRVQLVPETYAAQLEPTHYNNCPYARKVVYYDARTLNPLTMIAYGKKGELLHQHEGTFSFFEPVAGVKWPDGVPQNFWAWSTIHAMDMQSGKMTRMALAPSITGGYTPTFEDPKLFDGYCSLDALRRIGR